MSNAQEDNRAQTTVWTTDYGVLFGEYEDSRPASTHTSGYRRLNSADPVMIPKELMCRCKLCTQVCPFFDSKNE
jgi:hypothetical protein